MVSTFVLWTGGWWWCCVMGCWIALLGELMRRRAVSAAAWPRLPSSLLQTSFSYECVDYKIQRKTTSVALADQKGGQGRRSPRVPNSFILMQFSAKNLQNDRLAHPFWELAPPKENPGPATESISFSYYKILLPYNCVTDICQHWQIKDFTRGRGKPDGGGPTYYFAEFGPRGGACSGTPLDPPLVRFYPVLIAL